MTLEEILALFQYDEWATKRTIESVSSLSEEKSKRDFQSSHGGFPWTLIHIYWSDCLRLERWKGHLVPAPFDLEQISGVSTLSNRWQEYQGRLYAFLATIDDKTLSAPLSYTSTRGSKHCEPLYQQMQHKVNHSSYHRGQDCYHAETAWSNASRDRPYQLLPIETGSHKIAHTRV